MDKTTHEGRTWAINELFGYRRHIFLVQVLSTFDGTKLDECLIHLCEGWDIEAVWNGETLDTVKTIQGLSRGVSEHRKREQRRSGHVPA